jgi:hypothetical protein
VFWNGNWIQESKAGIIRWEVVEMANEKRLIDVQMKITSIRYSKKSGEFIVTKRNAYTGKTLKAYTNTLTENEKFWAKNSKHFFEDETCACWSN